MVGDKINSKTGMYSNGNPILMSEVMEGDKNSKTEMYSNGNPILMS